MADKKRKKQAIEAWAELCSRLKIHYLFECQIFEWISEKEIVFKFDSSMLYKSLAATATVKSRHVSRGCNVWRL